MHKKLKKNGKFNCRKLNTGNKLRKHQKQNDGHVTPKYNNEVIHVSQLFKRNPEERKQKVHCELKMRRKEEKLMAFNANRKLSEYSNRKREFNDDQLESNETEIENKFTDKSGKSYCKELRKVIEASDVILEVLDARDPQGCRSLHIEEMIMNEPNKRLILVLNKADLVPKESLDAWLKYFRSQHPTLLFKSSTQKQTSNLSHAKIKNSKFNENFKTSKCVGASALMQLLKNYCRNCGIKTAISVGVVGLPNVGKSSLINSLRRMKACNVGATPGVTKTIQEVSLDSKIRIIDCPGLILPSKSETDVQASLRNAFKIEKLKDLITPVNAILEKVGKEEIMSIYNMLNFGDVHEFLSLLAIKNGKMKRGGIPDVDKAAVMVLRDWNTGKIKYFMYPPIPSENDYQLTSTVVSAFSKEFNLEELEESNDMALKSLTDEDTFNSEIEKDSYIENNSNLNERLTHSESSLQRQPNLIPSDMEVQLPLELKSKTVHSKPKVQAKDLSNLSLKKFQKKQMKKFRKEKRRNEKRADDLADEFENFDFKFRDSND